MYANVRFVARTRPGGPAHDGEADLVLVHPDHGILVIETKSGEPRRDAVTPGPSATTGSTRSPFEQAEAEKHDLVRTSTSSPRRRPQDLASGPRRRLPGRGPREPAARPRAPGPGRHARDRPRRRRPRDPATTRRALERAWACWAGDGSRGRPLTPAQTARIHDFLAPTVDPPPPRQARRRRRHASASSQASTAQLIVLNQHRTKRRLEIVGPAGQRQEPRSRSRRHAGSRARAGGPCSSASTSRSRRPWARARRATGTPAARRPQVTTFHGLCETLGARAGTLPAKPSRRRRPRDWWDVTLPGALDDAIDRLPDERYHAIVVDEGQDFEPPWLTRSNSCCSTPRTTCSGSSTTPGRRSSATTAWRSWAWTASSCSRTTARPAPVAELANRFYRGPAETYAVTEDGPRAGDRGGGARPGRPWRPCASSSTG